MHSTAVKTQHAHYRPDVEYDVNVAVLVHYSGRFRERLRHVRRLGLLNGSRLRVHVTILGSDGNGSSAGDILEGWTPGFDVTLLEMASVHAIPKINGYYLWLATASLRARWHLRVDDDSVTDLGRLIAYADERFGDSPIHLVNTPLNREIGRPIFAEFLAGKGLKVPITHEYEASLTTDRAMKAVFASEAAMSFLAETGARFCGPGDRALAIAMHLCQIPTAARLPMTKDFRKSDLSLFGGTYAHIHYVNWGDSQFIKMLAALVGGATTPFTPDLLPEIVDKSLNFGRCVGFPINDLTFLDGGLIAGQMHRNEAGWRVNGNSLLLIGSDGLATTQFHTLLAHEGNRWLIGPYLKDSLHHYLEL